MEKEKYRYQAAISDWSNSDIFAHSDKAELVVKGIRDWLVQKAVVPPKSASAIHRAFLDFMAENYLRLKAEGYTHPEIIAMPVMELKTQMERWMNSTPTSRSF